MLGEWEEKRRKEELAEKRRVAPGWLDSGVHILKPENLDQTTTEEHVQAESAQSQLMDLDDLDTQAENRRKEGEDLDRVFGGLKV